MAAIEGASDQIGFEAAGLVAAEAAVVSAMASGSQHRTMSADGLKSGQGALPSRQQGGTSAPPPKILACLPT